MRDGAQSRSMEHCTVSIFCVVIYIFRHDQLLPTLVAGEGCRWCGRRPIEYSNGTVVLSVGGGSSCLNY